MVDLTPGARVCSKNRGVYYRQPGTVRCRCQVSFDNRAGWDYIIDLDNGQEVVINEYDLDTPTPEDEERDAERIRKAREWNEHIEERNRQRAEARERSRQIQRERREQAHAEKLAEQEAARQANNEEQRRKHAQEYGLDSLKH